jgi:type I restriction enzyme M protein
LGKTSPLNDDDFKEFVALQASFADSARSWSVEVAEIDPDIVDLSVRNPNKSEGAPLREPEEIIAEMAALDAESAEILEGIRRIL